MKLDYNSMTATDKERSQYFNLVKAMVKFVAVAGEDYDGVEMSHAVKNFCGLSIDHHVFTSVMDCMTRTHEAICTQGWGYTRYRIEEVK